VRRHPPSGNEAAAETHLEADVSPPSLRSVLSLTPTARCFPTAPMTFAAVSVSGNLNDVEGTVGSTVGCNVFQ